MHRRLTCLLLLVLSLAASCHSIERLGRVSPLSGDVAPERINLWPFYYRNGQEIAAMWPLYDQDDRGFALRPLVTHDEADWEVVPPLAWWNTETGHWIVLPVYSLGDTWGVFPLAGFGQLNYVGLFWWTDEARGLFPLATLGTDLAWVGPAWWTHDEAGDVDAHGLFPLYTMGERFHNVGPVLWGDDANGSYLVVFPVYGTGHLDDGGRLSWAGPAWWVDDAAGAVESWGLFPLATNIREFHQLGPVFWRSRDETGAGYLVAFPLFGSWHHEDGSGMTLSLLGGQGWDAEGRTTWRNVLGPLYHRSRGEDSVSTHVLWPLVHWGEDAEQSSWRLVPLVGASETKDEAGGVSGRETWALAGLARSRSDADGQRALRVAPLFSINSEDPGEADLLDWLTLYGSWRTDDGARDVHLGTPLVFDYHRDDEALRWDALLTALRYERAGEESSFDLLWYLYRRRTVGSETRRDAFPFISWDTDTGADGGEAHSRFAFLWRLVHWESRGDRTGGHFLFIPWGDSL